MGCSRFVEGWADAALPRRENITTHHDTLIYGNQDWRVNGEMMTRRHQCLKVPGKEVCAWVRHANVFQDYHDHGSGGFFSASEP